MTEGLKIQEILYAGFWARLWAELVDSVLLTVVSWVVQYPVVYLIYGLSVLIRNFNGLDHQTFSELFSSFYMEMINMVLYLLLAFPYYVYGHYKYQTTFGKKLFRVYVVKYRSQASLTIKQSVLRFIGYILAYLPMGAGFLMVAFHPEKRGLADIMGGSICVLRVKEPDPKDLETAL